MIDTLTLAQFSAFFPENHEVPRMLKRHAIARNGVYDDFVTILYEDLDVCIQEFQKSPELRQNDSEDRLTEELNAQLRRLGYDATHDTSAGGHVDVTVKLGTLTWVAEAKKDQKFIEGFLQLSTRYRPASGDPSHNAAGLIFYLVKNGKDVAGKLASWLVEMQDQKLPDFTHRNCQRNPFAFFTAHKAEWSGLPVHIRHVMVGMHHEPKDASGRAKVARALKAKAKPAAKKTRAKSAQPTTTPKP